jgi:hypothetical protein
VNLCFLINVQSQLKPRLPPSVPAALAQDTQSELAAALMRRRQAAQEKSGTVEAEQASGGEDVAASDAMPEGGWLCGSESQNPTTSGLSSDETQIM